MYKWRIDIILKCGKVVAAIHNGPENNSGDVADKLFNNRRPNEFIGLLSPSGTQVSYVCIGEIAAYGISERKEN